MSGEVVVFVTCSVNESERLASSLIDERLAACVNILPPVTSVYRWKGELCKETEVLLVIKSHEALWGELEGRIRTLHSYETPEIICLPIKFGHKPYLNWLNSELKEHVLRETSGKDA